MIHGNQTMSKGFLEGLLTNIVKDEWLGKVIDGKWTVYDVKFEFYNESIYNYLQDEDDGYDVPTYVINLFVERFTPKGKRITDITRVELL